MDLHLVAGARPNFMKIAPLYRALRERGVPARVVHTGQHYDERMSEVFFRQLDLPEPDLDLGIGSDSHARQTAAIMVAYEEVLTRERPDLVVVVGDVNSTVACALVATTLHVPVAHVEAGLRSGDRRMPEEVNRIVTDALSDLLFVTEASGVENLRREGIPEHKVHLVGNVMIDTLVRLRDRAREAGVEVRRGLESGRYALATFHRPSNVDDAGSAMALGALLQAVAARLPLVFPVHPRTRGRFVDFGVWSDLQDTPGLHLLEPQGYLEFLGLMDAAAIVLTDSGGVQEETTFLGTPCLTLRESTERPVTVTHGTNQLVPADQEVVLRRMASVLADGIPAHRVPPLWDGRAAERIAEVLVDSMSQDRTTSGSTCGPTTR